MLGNCKCKNLIVDWQIRDLSLVARACQCNYCRTKQAHWISKSKSTFSLKVRYQNHYQVNKHGSHLAQFHECTNCNEVVAVSTTLNKSIYGAINAKCLSQYERFPAAKKVFPETNQTITDRQSMWQNNWCCPVEIITPEKTIKLRLVK